MKKTIIIILSIILYIALLLSSLYALYINIDFITMKLTSNSIDVYGVDNTTLHEPYLDFKLETEDKIEFFKLLSRRNYSLIPFHSGFLGNSMRFELINSKTNKTIDLFFNEEYLEIRDKISIKVFKIKDYSTYNKIFSLYKKYNENI